MKSIRIIATVILVACATAICWGENNPSNNSMGRCQDNVYIEVKDLGDLPQSGKITVKFINPKYPEVSCIVPPVYFSNGSWSGKIWGNENNEWWSAVSVTVILGNHAYIATYSCPGEDQWKPIIFTGADFSPMWGEETDHMSYEY